VGYRFSAYVDSDLRKESSNGSNFVRGANQKVAVAEKRESNSTELVRKRIRSFPFQAAAIAGGMLVLMLGAAFTLIYSRNSTHIKITSIAVLPFENATGSAESEYLSDGISEMLIRQFSDRQGLSVKARSSVLRYKGDLADPLMAGRDLGAQAVVVGRIKHANTDYVFDIEIVDVNSGNVLFTQGYTRKLNDVASLSREITESIYSKLNIGVANDNIVGSSKLERVNNEAYAQYLRGRHFWNRRTNEDFRRAIECFQRAIELEPDFALAYSGLSDSYILLISFGGSPPENVLPQARSAAQRAVDLDPMLAEAHASLGNVSWQRGDLYTAEREFRKAIELNPNYATALQWLAEILSGNGNYDEADVAIRRALELDPLSRIIRNVEARNHFWAGRHDQAIALLKRNIDLDPTWGGDHDILFHVYEAKGMYAESVDAYLIAQSLLKGLPDDEIRLTRQSFEKGGWMGFVHRRIRFLEQWSKEVYVKSIILAEFYARAGQNDRAFDALFSARAKNTLSVAWVKHLAAFNGLRADPRYSELISKAN
jgi:TolB-like protein